MWKKSFVSLFVGVQKIVTFDDRSQKNPNFILGCVKLLRNSFIFWVKKMRIFSMNSRKKLWTSSIGNGKILQNSSIGCLEKRENFQSVLEQKKMFQLVRKGVWESRNSLLDSQKKMIIVQLVTRKNRKISSFDRWKISSNYLIDHRKK